MKIPCPVRMQGRVSMTGSKDTKTGLWMMTLAVDEAAINQEDSTNSQGASTIPEPMASQPTLPAILPINLLPTHHQECMIASIQSATTEMAGNLTPTTSMEELAKYHHQSVCSPTKAALLQGITNLQFRLFPRLTYKLINKYLPLFTATDKGHMVRQQQGCNQQEAIGRISLMCNGPSTT